MDTVSIATSDDKMALQALWQDAFHDDPNIISRFLDNVFEDEMSTFAIVAKRDGALCGMLFLLPATLYFEGKQYFSGYIYAVATDAEFQNQGIMKELERAACRLGTLQNMRVLYLIPQEKSLFSIYEKRGYRTVSYKEETRITPQYTTNYKLELCTKEQFFYRRNMLLSEKSAYFDLAPQVRECLFEQENEYGEVLFYSDSKDSGYMVVEYYNEYCKNICRIKETDLSISGISKAAFAIGLRGGKHMNFIVCKTGKRTPFAMAKSLDNSLNPFDIEKKNTYCALMLE